MSFELSADGSTYHLKSSRSTKSIVDVTVTRVAPGVMMGRNGTSTFGTDPAKPWGQMFHAFWPRCEVKGSFITPAGEVRMEGLGAYSFALQGMKPHHAGTYTISTSVRCTNTLTPRISFLSAPTQYDQSNPIQSHLHNAN